MTVSRTQPTAFWNLQNNHSNGKAQISSSPIWDLFANPCGPKRNDSPEVSKKVLLYWICSKLPVLELSKMKNENKDKIKNKKYIAAEEEK